ncbi:MAG: glycosyltransferase [Gemmataceae bacterium]
MHVLFIHPNFPAQFGHLAHHLATRLGWQCTCVTSVDTTHLNLPFTHINYKLEPGPQPKTFYNPSSLDGMMQHLIAVYRGLKGVVDLKPDLVVGHISYGTWLYLRNLYDCPFVGYFEVLPPPFWTEGLALRPEYPPPEGVRLFNAVYHALTYLHLHAMDAGYTPTHYQLTTCPPELQYKLKVIHDGIDTDACQPFQVPRPTNFRGVAIPEGVRVVTYVSRGLESLRGFDIFMKVAGRIVRERPDTIFLIAGDERTNYGHDLHHINPKTFKQHVLEQCDFDLKNFHFLGLIPNQDLPTMLNLGDLHMYFTAPFVLSWSMLQAMSCGSLMLGSATAPIQEVIQDGVNGLLADFDDIDGLAAKALKALNDPAGHKHLREAARQTILDKYAIDLCLKQLVDFFEDTVRTYPQRKEKLKIPPHAGRPPA